MEDFGCSRGRFSVFSWRICGRFVEDSWGFRGGFVSRGGFGWSRGGFAGVRGGVVSFSWRIRGFSRGGLAAHLVDDFLPLVEEFRACYLYVFEKWHIDFCFRAKTKIPGNPQSNHTCTQIGSTFKSTSLDP